MIRLQARDPVEGFTPGRSGLPGEAGDQIDVDHSDTCGTQHLQFGRDDPGRMLAPGAREFLWHEGLYAETDAVDAGCRPGAGAFRRDAAGRGFESSFDP